MADAFQQAYIAECDAKDMRANKHVLEQCEACVGIASGAELRCNGNSDSLREQRFLDLDVDLLAKALAKGHPFAVLDFSYNHLSNASASALAEMLQAWRIHHKISTPTTPGRSSSSVRAGALCSI